MSFITTIAPLLSSNFFCQLLYFLLGQNPHKSSLQRGGLILDHSFEDPVLDDRVAMTAGAQGTTSGRRQVNAGVPTHFCPHGMVPFTFTVLSLSLCTKDLKDTPMLNTNQSA